MRCTKRWKIASVARSRLLGVKAAQLTRRVAHLAGYMNTVWPCGPAETVNRHGGGAYAASSC